MEKRDVLALLQKKLGQQENSEEVTELAAALEYMPLAMVQAAAYISQRRPRCSVQQYLGDSEGATAKERLFSTVREDSFVETGRQGTRSS
jgi:hypothetical protein